MIKNLWANRQSIELVTSRDPPGGRRRPFLVFIVPDPSTPSPLLDTDLTGRNFDIAARFYAEPGCNSGLIGVADFVLTGGLSKFHAASALLRDLQLTEAYEGFLFLDGDLQFDPTQLGRFLSVVEAFGFDLAQPSVTRDSYSYWNMAYQQSGFLCRETSFVEVMAPYHSRRALAKTLPTFTKSISSYGLDFVWPHLVEASAIAVMDMFAIRHREKVDQSNGNFYKYLKSIGIDIKHEERTLLKEYGVSRQQAHSRRGYFWRGKEAAELRSVALPAFEKHTSSQFCIDLGMKLAKCLPSRREEGLEAAVRPILSETPAGSTSAASPEYRER